LIYRGALAVQHQTVAFDAQRNRKSVFECGEILIELSEQPEMIVQRA
jgi:hypothetical protein